MDLIKIFLWLKLVIVVLLGVVSIKILVFDIGDVGCIIALVVLFLCARSIYRTGLKLQK